MVTCIIFMWSDIVILSQRPNHLQLEPPPINSFSSDFRLILDGSFYEDTWLKFMPLYTTINRGVRFSYALPFMINNL